MTFCKVLLPFTEHVEGKGMVVGNAGATVDLPIKHARQRRARGYVDFDDDDAEQELVIDAARPKSQKERRLLARSVRRAAETGSPGPASRTPAPKAAAKPAPRKRAASTATVAASSLGPLRTEYEALVGKKPSPRLDATGLAAKIAELKASPEMLAAVKAAAPRKRAPKVAGPKPARKTRSGAAAPKSDAPVD